jgi:histidinol-phosphate aminotransferase
VENIWAANGSNEILQSIALAFSGDAMGFEPSYSMHPLINRSVGKKWISVPREADFSIDLPSSLKAIKEVRPGLVFLTTPNNPSGNATKLGEIESLAKTCQEIGAIFVVDEAYAEFSSSSSALLLLNKFPNLIISRTMSKAFAFAGVRVGYMIADPILIEAMLLIRLPYHLSSLTQAAALAALAHSQELSLQVAKIIDSRKLLAKELESLGLIVNDSEANFLLFTGFKGSSSELFTKLVDKGVLIRDVSIPGYLRVTVGTEDENKAFLQALTSLL